MAAAIRLGLFASRIGIRQAGAKLTMTRPGELSAYLSGAVSRSSWWINCNADSLSGPHISSDGERLVQTAGRSGWPNSRQRMNSSSCTHRSPAGLPLGIPGTDDEIDGAMQQAAHLERQ